MPTLVATPWPRGPDVVSTPEVHRYSGCPGHRLSSCRKFFRSASGTASSPSVSYFRFTAFTPVKCSREYRERRSVAGRKDKSVAVRPNRIFRIKSQKILPQHVHDRRHRHGVPGWPEFACWTASMHSVRMVLIERESIVCMGGFFGCGKSSVNHLRGHRRTLARPPQQLFTGTTFLSLRMWTTR